MNITKDVITDLLPLYLAGEATADTRALVEEYLARNPAFAPEVARQREALGLPPATDRTLDDEMRGLRALRRRLAAQRWVFALACVATATALTTELSFDHWRLTHARLLLSSSPLALATAIIASVLLWALYFRLKRRGARR